MDKIIFNFKNSDVKTILINNEPFFCASDVGKILELSNVYRQISNLKKGVHTVNTLTNGGPQNIIFISESNLYRLIFKSKKKEAVKFQDWIMESVIPQLDIL